MSLSIFIAPAQPRTSSMRNLPPPAAAASVQTVTARTNFDDPFDQRIHGYLLERVGFAIKSWTMLNAITAGLNPRSEPERRRVVKALLQRLKLLLHCGVVRRAGRVHVYLHVDGQPAPLSPFSRNIPRRRRRIRRKQVLPKRAASVATAHNSTSASAPSSVACQLNQTAAVQSVTTSPPAISANGEPWKTKSASAPAPVHPDNLPSPQLRAPSPAVKVMLRIALLQCGSQLARWRWLEPRKWTGYLHGERCWRGRRVLMSDGMRGAIIDVRRGVARVFADGRISIADSRLRRLHEREVVLLKLPQAVLLGSLKRGKTERPSEAKLAAARRNGSRPVRPGSRPRGRPRSAGVIQLTTLAGSPPRAASSAYSEL